MSLVVVDGDDTLWETEHLYDEARASVRNFIEAEGYDGEAWETEARRLDRERLVELGFSQDRFPGSLRLAFESIAGKNSYPFLSDAVEHMAREPFRRRIIPYPTAYSGLEALREKAETIVLLTKGDQRVQTKRVQDSGLVSFMDAVIIVPVKVASTFANIKKLYNSPSQCWSIGNSFHSDIVPAEEAGMNGMWVDQYVWDGERGAEADGRTPYATFGRAVDHILQEL